jgi:hypothetical protein
VIAMQSVPSRSAYQRPSRRMGAGVRRPELSALDCSLPVRAAGDIFGAVLDFSQGGDRQGREDAITKRSQDDFLLIKSTPAGVEKD